MITLSRHCKGPYETNQIQSVPIPSMYISYLPTFRNSKCRQIYHTPGILWGFFGGWNITTSGVLNRCNLPLQALERWVLYQMFLSWRVELVMFWCHLAAFESWRWWSFFLGGKDDVYTVQFLHTHIYICIYICTIYSIFIQLEVNIDRQPIGTSY